jgi:hypothetical protein
LIVGLVVGVIACVPPILLGAPRWDAQSTLGLLLAAFCAASLATRLVKRLAGLRRQSRRRVDDHKENE